MATRAAGDPNTDSPESEDDARIQAWVAEPYTDLGETRRRLRALLTAFDERGDRRGDFLSVYVRTTDAVAAQIRAGGFRDPEWVAEYLVTFANYYRRAVRDWEVGDEESVPTPWRLAFEAAASKETSVLQNAALGVNAHINYDLAFALAEVGIERNRETKRADHSAITDAIAGIVEEVWDALGTRRAEAGGPARDRPGPLTPLERGLAVCTIDECRDSAWRTAVALTSRSRIRRRVARWLTDASASAAARFVVGKALHDTERSASVERARSATDGRSAPSVDGRPVGPRPVTRLPWRGLIRRG